MVRVPPESEPASGSVSPYAPMTLPLAIGTRKRSFCSCVPARWSGLQPRLVCAATMMPSEPHTRRQLLDRDGVGERVEAGAALLLGKRDAEHAHLAQLGHDLGREAALFLVLLDDRLDFLGAGSRESCDGAARARAKESDPRPGG